MHTGLLIILCVSFVLATRPGDQIILDRFNQTYRIADETYTFSLVPTYWVPLQVKKHVIYTATTTTVASLIGTTLQKKRSVLNSLSEEDLRILESMIGTVPQYVKMDKQKRSTWESTGRIELAPEHVLLYFGTESEKRSTEQIVKTQSVCLHIPFFTTCDNSVDLQQVKDTLKTQQDAVRTEIDSYQKTNNARDIELTISLNKQRAIVQQIAAEAANTLQMTLNLVSVQKTNLVQTQHGDLIIHSQINTLKRVTNSILRYSNSLASTDPRALVAQAALGKLFRGYNAVLGELTKNGYKPILDADKFNFTENVLPSESIRNVTQMDGANNPDMSVYYGFVATLQVVCKDFDPNGQYCMTNTSSPYASVSGYFYGPFHTGHYGLYIVRNSRTGVPLLTREAMLAVQPIPPQSLFGKPALQCVNFLGSPVLATFGNTPDMLNGIPGDISVLPDAACTNHFIKAATSTVNHYRLFSMNEGLTIPFFSNCNREQLQTLAQLKLSTGYISKYPDVVAPMDDSIDTFQKEFNNKNYVSKDCYISIEPDWLELKYYVSYNPSVINDIPRGFRLNQYTINPLGELSSSLEFLYTTDWGMVYTITRTSTNLAPGGDGNHVIVDEVEILNNKKVLFLLRDSFIVDESNEMNGEANNGRDCIQIPVGNSPTLPYQYDYDILDCFYQNNQTGIPIGEYLLGLHRTSGISRYNSKFVLTLQTLATTNGIPRYSFSLKSKAEADFRFYVMTNNDQCPQLLSRSILQDTCMFRFTFTGSSAVTINNNPVTFTDLTANVSLPLSDSAYQIAVDGKQCLKVTCRKTISSTMVVLETPEYAIVSEADLNLQAKVDASLDRLLSGTLSQVKDVQTNAEQSRAKIAQITGLLSDINFNVTKLFPYENFANLRKSVDSVINKINSNYCSGPFASIECWARDFGATILAVIVIFVVALGIFCFCTRTEIGRKAQKAICGSTVCNRNSEYDYAGVDEDFKLTALNE